MSRYREKKEYILVVLMKYIVFFVLPERKNTPKKCLKSNLDLPIHGTTRN